MPNRTAFSGRPFAGGKLDSPPRPPDALLEILQGDGPLHRRGMCRPKRFELFPAGIISFFFWGEGAIMEAVVLLCLVAFILYKNVPPEVKLRLEYELYKRGFIKYK